MRRGETTIPNMDRRGRTRRGIIATLSALVLTAALCFVVSSPRLVLASPSPAADVPATLTAAGGEASVLGTSAAAPAVLVTVTPDATRSIAPGCDVSWAFDVANETTAAGVFDLSVFGTAGFPTTIRGADDTTASAVVLAAGETTRVLVTMSVPATTDVGVIDVTTFDAALETSAGVASSEASVTTLVRPALTIGPDNAAHASPNDDVPYTHIVTNSLPTSQTVLLSSADSHGWRAVFLTPDQLDEITSVTVGPYGGTAEIVAFLSVPTDVATPATDTLVVTATTPSATAEATDTTYIRRLETYADAAYKVPSATFRLTDTVYARATAFATDTVVCFRWVAPDGSVAQLSATSTVDASGTATDSYSIPATGQVGAWSLELHRDAPDGEVLEVRPFEVTYKGEIVGLSASDAPNVDDSVTVSASLANDSGSAVTSSTLTYLIWWDANGNGEFDAGDTYIDATGAPAPYSLDATTHVTAVASVPASGTWAEPEPWAVANTQFPNQGTYNVTAVWTSSTGAVIDTKTAEFYAVPALGWIPLLLMSGTIGYVMWRRRPALADAGLRR